MFADKQVFFYYIANACRQTSKYAKVKPAKKSKAWVAQKKDRRKRQGKE